MGSTISWTKLVKSNVAITSTQRLDQTNSSQANLCALFKRQRRHEHGAMHCQTNISCLKKKKKKDKLKRCINYFKLNQLKILCNLNFHPVYFDSLAGSCVPTPTYGLSFSSIRPSRFKLLPLSYQSFRAGGITSQILII